MSPNYFRLLIHITVKTPKGEDLIFKSIRTLPFQPTEGLTLRIPHNDDSNTEEYEVTLGPPTYSYVESGFVEYQETDGLVEEHKSGDKGVDALVREYVDYFKGYGFDRVVA